MRSLLMCVRIYDHCCILFWCTYLQSMLGYIITLLLFILSRIYLRRGSKNLKTLLKYFEIVCLHFMQVAVHLLSFVDEKELN